MNHASISPDGQLLVAVGDEPKAFFCKRVVAPESGANSHKPYASYEWREIAEIKLSVAPANDACFTTAFSPSGHICAVGTQSGVISIFETGAIHDGMEDDEAIIDVLRSSRASLPQEYVGAVRAMSFGPPPWDLFAWAEDRGRICVTDLRNAFRSRQTVDLDLDAPSINRATLSDLEDGQGTTSEQRQLEVEARFVQRHREALNAQDHLAAVSHAADYMELAAARRRLEREAGRTPGEFNDLTESERQMLDAIRTSRLPETEYARSETGQPNPFSVNYLQVQASDTPPVRLQAGAEAAETTPNNSNPNFQHSQIDGMREFARRGHFDRSRTIDRGTYQPRRRSSVVISSSSTAFSQSSTPQTSGLAPISTSASTLSASPSRLASTATSGANVEGSNSIATHESENAWQTISEALVHTRADTQLETASDRLRRQRREERDRDIPSTGVLFRHMQQQQQNARLERIRNTHTQRLRQAHEQSLARGAPRDSGYDDTEWEMLRRLADRHARREDGIRREEGIRTMGIGWNGDGRNL